MEEKRLKRQGYLRRARTTVENNRMESNRKEEKRETPKMLQKQGRRRHEEKNYARRIGMKEIDEID